jgi:hypothetical protein
MTPRPAEVKGIGVLPFPLVARPVSTSLSDFSQYGVIRKKIVIAPTAAGRSAGSSRASGRCAPGTARCDEGSPAMRRDDDPALAQYCHRVPDRGVGDPVFVGEAPLAGELGCDLALGDPSLDIVSDLDIGILSPKGINRTSRHTITIGCSLSCEKTR